MSGQLIFLYADKASPVSNDVPSISMPYKDLKEFRRDNPELKPWASYSMNHLLDKWGAKKETEQLQAEITKLQQENNKLKKCVEYTSKIRTFSNRNEAGVIAADKGKAFKAVYIARQTLKELTNV